MLIQDIDRVDGIKLEDRAWVNRHIKGHRDLPEQLHWRHSLRRGRGGCAQQGQGRRDDFAEHSRRITQVSEFTGLERFLGLHAYEERQLNITF